MTLPVLPFYIQNLFSAEEVSSKIVSLHVGLITAAFPFTQFFFSSYLGSLSDKSGKRPLNLGDNFNFYFFIRRKHSAALHLSSNGRDFYSRFCNNIGFQNPIKEICHWDNFSDHKLLAVKQCFTICVST